MGNNVNIIRTVGPATYGGTGPGGGAVAHAQEGLNRVGDTLNNEQAATNASGQANAAAQGAQTRGPQAEQNSYDANNAAGGANGNQAGAIELARRQAMGQAPGAGIRSLQMGLNQASSQQSAMAAGARGSGSIATAGANAAANTSDLQQNAFAGAGMMRSQDMAAGRGLYNTLASQGRDQAGQLQDSANQMGLANQGMNDSHALAMGNAATGFGGIANGYNGEAFNQTTNAMEPINAQDDANQANQEQHGNNRKQAVAANVKEG